MPLEIIKPKQKTETLPENSQLIKCSTVPTNVAMLPCLYSHSSQLGNGTDEGFLEGLRVGGPRIYGGSGPGVREQNLVRGEQALALLQILVVHVVEFVGRVWVHVDGYPRVHPLGAHLSKLEGV